MEQVKTVVKRQISRTLENKSVGFIVENAVTHNSSISAADCEPLIGEIPQGTDQFNRVGDRIKPKSLVVRGVLALNNSNVTGGLTQVPLRVRVMILAQKDIKVGAQVQAGSVDTSHLLEPNIAAANETDYSGTTVNALYPVNKDLFTVYYDKTFTLCGSDSTGVEAINRYCAAWSYRFKRLPSSLHFDNGNGDWANNFAPFLAVGYSYPDGSSADSITRRLVSTAFARMEYEDA